MSAVSPSGVASLRAKFEQKDESTSPPSRGRSPAASLSVTADASRPISKVRTSFVAVEPSGQMGGFNASEELGNKGDAATGNEAEGSTMEGVVEKPKTNGVEPTAQNSTKKEEEDNAPKQMTSKETPPLGSILKGSPFEQDDKIGGASNARENGATAEPMKPSDQQATAPNTPMTNGKPKEASAQKAGLQSKTKTAPRTSAIGKKTAAQPASSTEDSENKPQTHTLHASSTLRSAATPSRQPLSKKISPKSAASKEPKKEVSKDVKKTTAERPSRPSVAPAPAAASKPAPKLGKKPRPTSPPSFTKPRPKSPTRPVRLPGSATAPTAASAAKLDAATAATAKPRDRVSSNPISLQKQPARTSMPAGSKPVDKAKDKPKSRLSTVSAKTPEGSFLDRMMRPTQSSSQKAHEKVEARTPPKKTTASRPKRKSDGSEQAKSENVETIGTQPTDSSPSPPVQAPADSSGAPSTNGGNNGTDEVDPAFTAPIPSQ